MIGGVRIPLSMAKPCDEPHGPHSTRWVLAVARDNLSIWHQYRARSDMVWRDSTYVFGFAWMPSPFWGMFHGLVRQPVRWLLVPQVRRRCAMTESHVLFFTVRGEVAPARCEVWRDAGVAGDSDRRESASPPLIPHSSQKVLASACPRTYVPRCRSDGAAGTERTR